MTTPSVPYPQAPSHNLLKRSWRWYFTQPDGTSDHALDIVAWWEIRRIPFNILIGTVGIASLAAWLSIGSLPLMTERVNSADAVGAEPLSVLAAPFLFNLCYTAGWMAEITLKWLGVLRSGPILMKLGMGLSLTMVSFVGVYWCVALLVEVVSVVVRTLA
jgi:hypothetical protein